MTYRYQIESAISDIEYASAKYNFVLSNFPDCELQRYYPDYISKKPHFISKSINQKYNRLKFNDNKFELSVIPYFETSFVYKDKCESITIYSDPKKFILAHITDAKDKMTKKISFTKLSAHLKNNDFNDKMLNSCGVNILNFIKKNSGYKIDDKHLEPRLKKLLVFI